MSKKTSTQLDREIAETLASSTPKKLTAKRAKDFRDSGNYEVRDESGTLVALLFRDPESREWYEDSVPGMPQTHYTERWRGLTQADALAAIARRRGLSPMSTTTSPHHATKKPANKAWYVFYIPKGRMPKSFSGKSGWNWPKAYFGPYESRAAATSAVQGEMTVFEEPATRYKIRNVTPREFAKLWGRPPESGYAPPWSVELKRRGLPGY